MSKARESVRIGATFVAAVGLTMGVLHGGIAMATNFTIPGQGCIQKNGTYVNTVTCGVTGGSAMAATPGIADSYFDFQLAATTDVTISFYKTSYTGTIEGDYRTMLNKAAGTYDEQLVANLINNNRSVWDYYWTSISAKNLSTSTFYGVVVRTM
jgi:hypothetical protein